MSEQVPVYVISVAARLLAVHPQTLRNYERAGFLRPTRTEGKRRLYSAADIERLRHLIGTVEQFGLNLAGLKMLLVLQRELRGVEARLDTALSPEDSTALRVQVRQMLALLSGDTALLGGDESVEDEFE